VLKSVKIPKKCKKNAQKFGKLKRLVYLCIVKAMLLRRKTPIAT